MRKNFLTQCKKKSLENSLPLPRNRQKTEMKLYALFRSTNYKENLKFATRWLVRVARDG